MKRGKGNLRSLLVAIAATVFVPLSCPALAQVETEVPPVVEGAKRTVIERIKVHSPAIEGNLEGNTADREVIVVLPPSYRGDPARRYPVVYALHGYSIGAEQWIGEIHVPQVVEGAFAQGVPEMIVVLPDSKTVHNGSMYSASVTTGDFETFISRDLVSYVDSHYRTLPRRESRGLVGHSMGGYGATRIGFKHSDTFGALYLMSPCCMQARPFGAPDANTVARIESITSQDQLADMPFQIRGLLAMAAAWSPDPAKPPLFIDLPVKDGKVDEEVYARWTANSPFAMLDQYVPDLKRYAAIAMDVGDEDGLKEDTRKLHEKMLAYGIENSFELYSGTHTSRVAFRFQDHVLPFFGANLSAEEPPPPTSPPVAGDMGSGPYPAIMEVDPALAKHVIYRPRDLAPFGEANKMPIYIWGNGACSDDAASVRNHLLEIASHGYLVVAPGYIGEELERVHAARPPAEPGAPPIVPTTTGDLRDGLDWVIAQGTLAGSKYRGKLDPAAVAASGFSCGGVQAIDLATSDSRVSALVVQNSGLFPDGSARMAGMDTPKSALAKFRFPVLYIQGGPTDIAWDNGYDDFQRIDNVPAALVGLPTGHGGTYFDPHGGAAASIALDWLDWQLRGDATAAETFLGANCRICTVPGWTIERKGF